MCDLIDLNSSDVRGALEPAKLASPLIPAPKNIECDDGTNLELVTEKRESDGNNPFDQVLHETVEYVNKKGDPFEVMLQRALRSKSLRNAQSVDFTDDFTPRKKRYFKTMNKTFGMLDESFKSRFGLFNRDKKEAKIKTRSVGIDMRNADICDSDTADSVCLSKQEHKISIVASDSLELSILNQSAMNDTLLEGFPKSKESDKVSLFLEKDMAFEESVFPSNVKHLKLSDTQRSLSQGSGKSPTELLYQNRRSQSVTEDKRKVLQSDNSTISSFLDRGFMESRSEQSVLSSLSNISSITKLTSASLSSSILSNDPMNHAFLDNSSLKMGQDKMSTTENSMEMKLKQYELSDLAERFNKLKCIMNNTTNISSITEEDSNSMKEENIKRIANNKLIDVDVFVPEQNKEFNRSSSSTCSSDSVFTNTSKIDKSILKEAKVLAKTFEELTSKTDSGSIEDDFISNNTLWMSELLPAFEDEPVVNDLIDLPVSPERNLKDIKNSDTKQSPASVDSAEENIFKEMESPFTNSSVVKQNITSLLLDLRKLVKESNPKAKKLLDDLENILDINYKNNTELLVTCFNTSNKSQSSLKISSESIERFNKSSTGKSEEKEDSKILFSEKLCSDEKSLPDINTLKDTSLDIVSIEKSLNMSLSCKDNSEDCMSTSNLSEHSKQKVKKSKEKDNQVDKKVAIELLINLKKLLSGQAEDAMTIKLLKNIGRALNTALNSTENEMQANYIEKQNIQQTTPVRNRQESSRNVHSSTLSTKMVHRRSLESKSKKIDRRSISAIESSPKNTQICRRKNTSESENRQKRFSSDPGFINNLSNKKLMPEAYNSRKEVAKSDSGKEKSIAISDVKNKLKKRSDVINKRGPMKAVHPLDNIQKRKASFGRQAPSSQIITPPKSDKAIPSDNKIISSTPNSTDNYYMPKKPSKSKPIASSTPDGQNSKSVPLISANKKRNLSCDISPVTTHVNMLNSDEQKNSPKRMSKLPTPKKCTTPTRQQTDGIPRFLTPPRHYSFNTNNLQSPQRLNKSLISFQRYSPANEKNVGKTIQQSPLKETNRITPKVKPFNLVSKIKRHSISNFAEKENNYVRD